MTDGGQSRLLPMTIEVVLKDGTRLILSRRYRAEVETMLGQSL